MKATELKHDTLCCRKCTTMPVVLRKLGFIVSMGFNLLKSCSLLIKVFSIKIYKAPTMYILIRAWCCTMNNVYMQNFWAFVKAFFVCTNLPGMGLNITIFRKNNDVLWICVQFLVFVHIWLPQHVA